MNITLKVVDINPETFQVESLGNKVFFAPEKLASEWIRKEIKGRMGKDCPQMTSFIGIKQDGRGNLVQNSIGYFHNNANCIYHNMTLVGLYTSAFSAANGLSIIPENINKVVALFTARKTIKRNWINWQDEYSAPNESHPEYAQWNNDCFVYSLFESKSNQSSLRQVEYKGKLWDIVNHFFFMSKEEMMTLADDAGWHEMYQMAKTEEDRYVFNLLESMNLSEDSQEVLEAGRELVRKSFAFRQTYAQEHPEYHLTSWDAGWAQIKPMLKEHFSDDYKAFVNKFKQFEKRMREGVFTFGFLVKDDFSNYGIETEESDEETPCEVES